MKLRNIVHRPQHKPPLRGGQSHSVQGTYGQHVHEQTTDTTVHTADAMTVSTHAHHQESTTERSKAPQFPQKSCCAAAACVADSAPEGGVGDSTKELAIEALHGEPLLYRRRPTPRVLAVQLTGRRHYERRFAAGGCADEEDMPSNTASAS